MKICLSAIQIHNFNLLFGAITSWQCINFFLLVLGGYVVNKIIHGCLKTWNISSIVQVNISQVSPSFLAQLSYLLASSGPRLISLLPQDEVSPPPQC